MEQLPPVLQICDLPNEILEMVVPDHEPKTISNLKLINRRFYHLLTNDRYYQHFIKYPVKYMLCWMKNRNSSCITVTEAIENGEIGKWKGLLTLEKLHLENWRCGRITRCEKIPLPPLLLEESQYSLENPAYYKYWDGMVDDDGEHWLVGVNPDQLIILINVSDEPKVFIERSISRHRDIHAYLLPGQVICKDFLTRQIVVFDIVKSGGEISMRYKCEFYLEGNGSYWRVCKSYKGNIFVKVNVLAFDGLLRFRNLTTGKFLENVNLLDYQNVKSVFEGTGHPLRADILNDFSRSSLPYVMVGISSDLIENVVVVVIFDLEKMKATNVIKVQASYVSQMCINKNVAYIFTASTDLGPVEEVRSLPLEEDGDCEELKVPNLLIKSYIDSKEIFYSWQIIYGQMFLISYCDENCNSASIVSLTEPDAAMQINVDNLPIDPSFPSFEIDFIGPDVLAVRIVDCIMKMFKVTRKEQGFEVEPFIDWEKAFSEHETHFRVAMPVRNAKDFSKIILYDSEIKDNDFLAIFHF